MREHQNELIVGLVSLVPPLGSDETLRRTEALLADRIASPMKTHKRLVEGDRFDAEKTLRELADIIGCDWILTFGGMGPARTDVLPDAVRSVAQKELPGLALMIGRLGGAAPAERLLMRPAAALRETPKNSTLCMTLPDDFAAAERILTDGDEAFLPALAAMLQKTQGISIELRADESGASEAEDADVEAASPAPVDEPQEESAAPQTPEPPQAPEPKPEPAFGPKDILVSRPRADFPTELTVVWLHGMGVDNTDFASFPDELLKFGAPACRFVLPNAPVREISVHPGYPMRAWYDFRSERIDEAEDDYGIRETSRRVAALIDELESQGTPRSRIVLGGFSQGAAISLFCGLRLERPIAGLVSLSGYLPLAGQLYSEVNPSARGTPVFMGHGDFDYVVDPMIAKNSARVISEINSRLTCRLYPIEHHVCAEELSDLAEFLNRIAAR